MVLQHHHHLEWHQMEFHLDLVSHQMVTLEQHLMEHPLDQESVPMALQHHRLLELHQTEFLMGRVSHQMGTLEQHQMEHLLDQE